MEFLKMNDELRYLKRKYEMIKELESLVTSVGYNMIEPAFFEEYESFIKINKRIKKESMVKMLNNDGTVMILRPDATMGIIKQVLSKWEEGLTLKFFYNTTVFSQTNQTSINEKGQFGIEYFGEKREVADQEVMQLVYKLLKQFSQHFTVEIGNSKFITSLLIALDLMEHEEQELKEIIYYKNQYGLEQFLIKQTIPKLYESVLRSLLTLQGSLEDIERKLSKLKLNEGMLEALNELKSLEKSLKQDDLIYSTFDLAMLTQYDYYDGITFKGYYPNIPKPILSGGRYDQLTNRFGRNLTAIGFSISTNDLMKEGVSNVD